jgi:hypothetical protein
MDDRVEGGCPCPASCDSSEMSVFLLSYRSSIPTYGPAATRIRMLALAMPPMVSPRSFSTRSACRTCAGDMPAGCCRRRSTICCRIWESGRGRVGQQGCGDGGGFGGAADSNPGWPIRDFHIVTIRSSSCSHRPVRRSRCSTSGGTSKPAERRASSVTMLVVPGPPPDV